MDRSLRGVVQRCRTVSIGNVHIGAFVQEPLLPLDIVISSGFVHFCDV